MNRKKVILSVFLMIFLILIGLTLPSMWKNQRKTEHKESEEPIKTEVKDTPDTEDIHLDFIDFDALKAFFSESQITSLKKQFPIYLEETKKDSIKSVTFLPDQTTYPANTAVELIFTLSDNSTLPVTYSTSTGVFLFGKEKLQVSTDTEVYEKPTDDKLPSVTPEDVEKLQEGGYPNTTNTPEHPDAAKKGEKSPEKTFTEEDSQAEETEPADEEVGQ